MASKKIEIPDNIDVNQMISDKSNPSECEVELEKAASLIGSETGSVLTETSNPTDTSSNDYEEVVSAKKAEAEAKRLQDPEIQAQIIYENYINSTGRFMSGQQKRTFRRECLKNAKKGKYNYLFDPEKQRAREERQRAKFEKLNKPVVHTVDDLSEETKADLLKMADAETVPEFNKETQSFDSANA